MWERLLQNNNKKNVSLFLGGGVGWWAEAHSVRSGYEPLFGLHVTLFWFVHNAVTNVFIVKR